MLNAPSAPKRGRQEATSESEEPNEAPIKRRRRREEEAGVWHGGATRKATLLPRPEGE